MSEKTDQGPRLSSQRAAASRPSDRARAVRRHVTSVVEHLQRQYLPSPGAPPTSDGAAALATLRRGTTATGAVDPRVWALILEGLPEELERERWTAPGDLTAPTRGEMAVHAALTTYAVHQQSEREPMHVRGIGLGQAVRQVARAAAADAPDAAVGGLHDPTVQRMHRVGMAQTQALRVDALRTLVSLLRSADRPQPLDYGQLGQDLYWLQSERGRASVQLSWGRDLHRHTKHTDRPTSEESPSTADHDKGVQE